jgi:valyl-tRNA synthetase
MVEIVWEENEQELTIPDLLQLIGKYGADAVRFGIMISRLQVTSLVRRSRTGAGPQFQHKLWNALKPVSIWGDQQSAIAQPDTASDGRFCGLGLKTG